MVYADYTYYTTEYGGTVLTEQEFNTYITAACAVLDEYTFGRIAKDHTLVDTQVQNAACALTETLQSSAYAAGNNSALVASENVDGLSVTYRTNAEQHAAFNSLVNAALMPYLPVWHPLRSRWLL